MGVGRGRPGLGPPPTSSAMTESRLPRRPDRNSPGWVFWAVLLALIVVGAAFAIHAVGTPSPSVTPPPGTACPGTPLTSLVGSRTPMGSDGRPGPLYAGPSPRWGPMMAYDPTDGYVLLFGGSSGGNETWAYQSGHWTELHPKTSPPPRSFGNLVYDPAAGYLLLFGGQTGGPGTARTLNDTWTYAHGTWTNVTPAHSPSSRHWASMAYDSGDQEVVLFGGAHNNSQQYLGDTWTYAHGVWTEVSPALSPTPRYGAVLVNDPRDGDLVLYGGETDAVPGGYYANDTWIYEDQNWTELPTEDTPPGRLWDSASFDCASDAVVVFGGQANHYKSYNSTQSATWAFEGGVWTNLTGSSPAPPARFGAGCAYDPSSGSLILFGGLNATVVGATVLSDTWAYVPGHWTEILA